MRLLVLFCAAAAVAAIPPGFMAVVASFSPGPTGALAALPPGPTAAAAALAAVAAAQPLAQAVTIVPGRSIGPLEVGMALDRARGLMDGYGTVEEVDTPATHGFCNPEAGVGVCAFDRWQRLGLNSPGVVAFIITDDARFATESGGLKVGQPLLEFLRTFGLYSSGQGSELRWDGRGLAVDVVPGESGIVVRLIGVFAPRAVVAGPPAGR
jgi:hypothetical protein